MIRTSIAVATLATLALVPTLAAAKSIRANMTADQISNYCASAGVGTTTTTVDVGGKHVTGTVDCTANDIKTVASTNDTGESEAGATEAAENGKED